MEYPNRKSLRLKDYDYSNPGGYFITICTYKHENLFGEIVKGKLVQSSSGSLVRQEWARTLTMRQEVVLDHFVVMPNHFHAIVLLMDASMSGDRKSPLQLVSEPISSIANIVSGFKAACTKNIRLSLSNPNLKIWQRGYHDHIIRSEKDLMKIREYIVNNPQKWELDKYYSVNEIAQ